MKGGIESSGSRLRTSLYGSKLHAQDLSQGQTLCKFNAPVHKKHSQLTIKKINYHISRSKFCINQFLF